MLADFTQEYQRYVVELRTMLAYPHGTRAILQDELVLQEIVNVYPVAWNCFLTFSTNTKTWPLIPKRPSRTRVNVSTNVFNIFLNLGRREITERIAIEQLSRLLGRQA
jgi:hypothetical protein